MESTSLYAFPSSSHSPSSPLPSMPVLPTAPFHGLGVAHSYAIVLTGRGSTREI